ncbi:MAG: DUF835 domain-containing protein [bacterium]|nr:DUF835 domain-containing protein [bacterium]
MAKLLKVADELKGLERREWQLWALITGLFLAFVFFISLAYFYWRFETVGIKEYTLNVLLLGFVGLSLLFCAHVILTELTIKRLRNKIVEAERSKLEAERNKMIELREAYKELDSIIKDMADSLIVIDLNGKITAVNKATCTLLGYKEEELIDKPAGMLFTEEPPFKGRDFEKLIKGDYIRDYELTCVTKSGDKIPVIFSSSVMRDKDDNVIGIVGVAHNGREIERLRERDRNLQIALGLIKLPLKYSLKMGNIYFIKEKSLKKSYETFLIQITHGSQGLCFTKLHPEEVRRMYGLTKTPIIWLTFRTDESERTIPFTKLDELTATVSEYVNSVKNSVVLIDCFNHIKLLNGFEQAMKFLYTMKRMISGGDSNLLITIDPDDFTDAQLSILEKKAEELK